MKLLLELESYKLKLSQRNTTIIGNSASGKTFVVNQLKNKGLIVCEEIFDYENNQIRDELEKNDIFQNIIKFFKIENLIKKSFNSLSYEDKAYLIIIKSLAKAKEVLVVDNLLTYLNFAKRNLILTYLKVHDIILINVTNDDKLFLINDYMIVLDKRRVAIEGPTKLVLKEEKLITRLGFCLPFVLDVSSKLKDYNILKELCYTSEELRDELWKKTI